MPILVNMFKYMQYIPYIPMFTTAGQYSQIHTNTLSLSLKYIPIQRHTDEYLPILTIHIITY